MSDVGSGAEEGARCAQHPERGATGRCGDCAQPTCELCTAGGVLVVCPACRARATAASAEVGVPTFALARESWSFSALWDHCFAAFQREWVMLSVAALVMMLVVYALAFAAGILGALVGAVGGGGDGDPLLTAALAVLQVVVQYGVQGALSLGLMRIALDVLHGEKADLGRLFSQLSKAPGYVLALAGAGLAVAAVVGAVVGAGFVLHRAGMLQETGLLVGGLVAFLLLIAPIVYFTLPLYFLVPELVLQERPVVMSAVRNCYRVARGHRLEMLGISLLGGALTVVGLFACCVGVFPALGLMTLLMGGLYLALRRGALLEDASLE